MNDNWSTSVRSCIDFLNVIISDNMATVISSDTARILDIVCKDNIVLNQIILSVALKASALYQATGDKSYLEILKNLLLFYADNYRKFPLHDKAGNVYQDYETMKWGCGRILPQGLNEAIITTRMIQALEIVKAELDHEFLDKLYTNMFSEIYQLLKPQVNRLSNISCWKNAAIGLIGLFFDKEELVDYALNSEYGLNYQIAHGVTDEYFWYEGSIHYNFFTLEGLTVFVLFSKIYDYKLTPKIEETIKNMMVAAYHYAFNNLYFPNPNDGWPDVNLKTYSYIYHVMAKCYGYESEIGKILQVISRDQSVRTTLPLSKPYYVFQDISFVLISTKTLKRLLPEKASPEKSWGIRKI